VCGRNHTQRTTHSPKTGLCVPPTHSLKTGLCVPPTHSELHPHTGQCVPPTHCQLQAGRRCVCRPHTGKPPHTRQCVPPPHSELHPRIFRATKLRENRSLARALLQRVKSKRRANDPITFTQVLRKTHGSPQNSERMAHLLLSKVRAKKPSCLKRQIRWGWVLCSMRA